MVKLGYISQEQADKMTYPTNIHKPDANQTSAAQYGKDTPTAFVVHHVMDELLYHTGGKFTEQDLKTGGFKVVTTIDKTYEDAAINIVDKTKTGSLLANQPPRLAPALVAIDPKNGRVLAYYGGHDGSGLDEAGVYRDPILEKNEKGEPDDGWRGLHHSPGSTFKMYTLATALSQGYSIDSYWLGPSSRRFNGRGLEPDPTHPGQYRETNKTPPVTNSDGDACPKQDGNYCSLQQALKLSTNTVYYGVGVKVGPDKVIDMAHAMGIQHVWDGNDKRYDLSDKGDGQTTWSGAQLFPTHISPEVAIGQYGITVMDNAAGVATIANGGVHFETHFVQSVSRGGQPVYNEVTKLTNLSQSMHLSRDQMADEQWAMSTVIENSGGVNKLNGRPAASKTGTWEVCATTNGCPKQYVNQTRDAWYAGFTPDLATVVHIGSNDPNNPVAAYYNSGSKKENVMFGINTPGQVWKKFMDTVLKNKDKTKLLQAKHVAGTREGEGQSPEPQQPSNPPDGGNGNGGGNGQPCVPPNCQPTDPGQVTASPSKRRPGG
jgi:membrane peptidoglycan carboxypeptidase